MASNLIEIDIKEELTRIKSKGYIKSLRKNNTGVGYTLETLLGLRETNKRGVQDFSYNGVPTELKSQRKTSKAWMTLFTKEPPKDEYNDRDMIRKYGYSDKKGRPALKVRIKVGKPNKQELSLLIDKKKQTISILDKQGNTPWVWEIDQLKPKIDSLVVVMADKKGSKGNEEFHYNEAYHLYGLHLERFWGLFDEGNLVIEPRMHIKPTGSIRNRGTAIRVKDVKTLYDYYSNIDRLI
jgi:hypothetical protein